MGANILDLPAAHAPHYDALSRPTLNEFLARGRSAWRELYEWTLGQPHDHPALIPLRDVELRMPVAIGDYTDFYASIHHATNVGSMFRPDNPLLPNYKYVPIAYHGRASSIVLSGTPVKRPSGQLQKGSDPPVFAPTRQLDYELEVGVVVGSGNEEPVSIDDAEDHIFGLCLVNDWSARDIQRWEYQPLGPFLSKSFATSISPWIVPLDALEASRVPLVHEPPPLPYLYSAANEQRGGLNITLEVYLETEQMRARDMDPLQISHTSFGYMYWTIAQMVTHHTSNGCNLRPGDLLASGTVSGPEKFNRGCLLERTWRGTAPIQLPSGETRAFLEDGDEVILRSAELGECRGRIMG